MATVDKTVTTEQWVRDLLTENTGSHFLDSGGAYRRHHEKNQGRDFKAEPHASLSFGDGFIGVTLSTYHWLCENLCEPCVEQQKLYDAWSEARADTCHLEDMEAWPKVWAAMMGSRLTEKPVIENTYNSEHLIDQTLQYVSFAIEWPEHEPDGHEGTYVLLQVHGGCDVRGGYTAPRIFRLAESTYDLSRVADASIWSQYAAPNPAQAMLFAAADLPRAIPPPHWYTDDAYNWYGEYQARPVKRLREYEITADPALRGRGYIYADPQGHGHCPVTGNQFYAGF